MYRELTVSLSIYKEDEENELFDYSTISSATSDSKQRKHTPLDPNHTHFILVDNSQLNVYGGEIEFRGITAALESSIMPYLIYKISFILR